MEHRNDRPEARSSHSQYTHIWTIGNSLNCLSIFDPGPGRKAANAGRITRVRQGGQVSGWARGISVGVLENMRADRMG
jgi:hypothetical protein